MPSLPTPGLQSRRCSRTVPLLQLLLALLPAITASAVAAETDPALAYFRELAETRNYTLGRPVSPRLTPDGRTVIFLRSGPRDPTLLLWELDVATGRERELLTPARLLRGAEEQLSPEEKARRERSRQTLRGFTTYQLSPDGTRLLVTLSGQLYLVARADLSVVTLPGHGWIDPRFSPDGRAIAAAGPDRELHVIDLTGPAPVARAITSGASATVSHGTAEFVAQEEMSRPRGFWWAPDSAALLVQETDESPVEVRYIADPLHPETAPAKFHYPRAGTPNAVVRLHLVPRTGGTPRPVIWDQTAFPYLAHVAWPARGALTLLVQNREQTDQRLLAVDPATGRTAELLRETDSAWLNLDDNASGSSGDRRPPFWLADGSHFLWTSEHSGAWQVQLRQANGDFVRALTPATLPVGTEVPAPDGTLRPLRSAAAWFYRGIVALDEKNAAVIVRGSTDATEVHLWSFPLDGRSPPTVLSRGRGVHAASYTASAQTLVRTSDLWNGTWRTELVSLPDQAVRATLPSVAAAVPQLPSTRLGRTAGAEGFDFALTRPRLVEAGKKYPVILSVYAGPTSKRVSTEIRGYLSDQWMADQGYFVVRLDGRGTPWRGRAWERAIKGNFIDVALADQVDGLRALAAAEPQLDLTRVAVSGWSFGGYFAAMAAIRRPDVFRAGVVGAPVITWENYDTHYTERYLGLPQSAPDAYKVSNVTTYAAQASRPLLLIHGLTDDNVYFQHTLQLADALFMAGKPYELLPMLGTHMVSDPLVRLRQQTRIMDFIARSLRD